MKRMYAILAVLFIAIAALIIFVFADDQRKTREAEATATHASSDETEPEDGSRKASQGDRSEDILPSLPFETVLSFQAAKVKEVPGKSILSLELYDTDKEGAKLLDNVRSFDFSSFTATGELDEDYYVYSFHHIYQVADGEFHKVTYQDIKVGDMLLLLQDYTNHYYILIYRNT